MPIADEASLLLSRLTGDPTSAFRPDQLEAIQQRVGAGIAIRVSGCDPRAKG